MKKILTSLLSLSLLSAPVMAKDILDKLTVADGFNVSLFADDVENARQIAVSKKALCMLVREKRAMFMRLSIITVMVLQIRKL